MKKLRIHYNVVNCGDGSAYPTFFNTKKQAEAQAEWEFNNSEGWGEECVGSLEIEIDDDGKFYIQAQPIGYSDKAWNDEIYLEGEDGGRVQVETYHED